MSIEEFEEKVLAIDWEKYSAPEYHDSNIMDYYPNKVPAILIGLSKADETNAGIGLASLVRVAVGNDHRGTYYPAALEAIDLIVELEKNSDNKAVRECAYDILNVWYYFRLEMSKDDEKLHEAVDKIIREKLEPYKDET